MCVAPDRRLQFVACGNQLALTTKVLADCRQLILDGLQVLLEALDLEKRAHAMVPRTSTLPVTTAVISAVRYSCRRSMAVSTLETIRSIFAVSSSRKSAIAS